MAYEQIAVYILFNRKRGALYVGVTSYLTRRIYEHRTHVVEGFTKRYNVTKLGYYELYESMTEAIRREKRLKKYSRAKKIELIESTNPLWNDLWKEITE